MPPATTHPSDKPKIKDVWDKIDISSKAVGAILVPVAIFAGTYLVNSALQERSATQKIFEVAVTILQSKDTGSPELKAWARGVFEKTTAAANQPLSPPARQELKVDPLPTPAAAARLISQFERSEVAPQDLQGIIKIIKDNIKVPITGNQQSALTSYIYNRGPRVFLSELVPLINAQRFSDVERQIRHASDNTGLQGLIRRRQLEADLWGQPDGKSD